MSKKFSYILIPIMILGFLIAPISPVLKIENGKISLKTEIKKAEAIVKSIDNYFAKPEITILDKSAKAVKVQVKILVLDGVDKEEAYNNLTDINVVFAKKQGEDYIDGKSTSYASLISTFDKTKTANVFTATTQALLTPETTYRLGVILLGEKTTTSWILDGAKVALFLAQPLTLPFLLDNEANGITGVSNPPDFTTLKLSEDKDLGPAGMTSTSTDETGKAEELSFGCNLRKWSVSGCVAELFLLIFNVSAYIMELAGRLLDFFLFYSLNSSAYSSVFIEKGWGILRDVANIFFIIALLYIAIKTILNLNVSNNKKLISSIIIVALIINFSLFVTQVVIDSSNILAKVFYNQITTVKEDNSQAETGAGGEKSISLNLVSGFNPQNIIKTDSVLKQVGNGGFIFITIIMILLCLYCAYMFFVVSILFVGRVVSLWISMIFAPLAFVSYAVPFDLMGFGHKKWWKNLLESAFLAPIFIFFLYIIILFIELGKEAVKITYSNSSSVQTTQEFLITIMGVIIPFALIFLMLTRAKKIAVDYSGELGAMISKVGKVATMAVGGAAVGAAGMAGGAVLRGTVGRAGSAMANSQWATKMASSKNGFKKFVGNKFISAGQATGKASFDIRGASIGGKSLASTGLKVGTAKKGGFEQAKAEQKAKRDERAAHLKEVSSKPEKKKLHESEMARADLATSMKKDLDPLEKTIDKLKETLTQQSQALGKDDPKTKATYLSLQNAQERKQAMLDGKQYEGDKTGRKIGTGEFVGTGKFESVGEVKDKDGNIIKHGTTREIKEEIMKDERDEKTATDYTKDEYNAGEITDKDGKVHKRTIKYLDTIEIKDNAKAVFDKEAATLKGYASGMDSKLSKTFNFIFSGGMHSGIGAEESQMNIEKMARHLEERGNIK